MLFKVFTVLSATIAFAQAGLLAAPAVAYSPANEVSHVYSSIGAVAHQPIVAHGLKEFQFDIKTNMNFDMKITNNRNYFTLHS